MTSLDLVRSEPQGKEVNLLLRKFRHTDFRSADIKVKLYVLFVCEAPRRSWEVAWSQFEVRLTHFYSKSI